MFRVDSVGGEASGDYFFWFPKSIITLTGDKTEVSKGDTFTLDLNTVFSRNYYGLFCLPAGVSIVSMEGAKGYTRPNGQQCVLEISGGATREAKALLQDTGYFDSHSLLKFTGYAIGKGWNTPSNEVLINLKQTCEKCSFGGEFEFTVEGTVKRGTGKVCSATAQYYIDDKELGRIYLKDRTIGGYRGGYVRVWLQANMSKDEAIQSKDNLSFKITGIKGLR